MQNVPPSLDRCALEVPVRQDVLFPPERRGGLRRLRAAPVPVTHRVDADRVGALPAVHQGQEMDKVQRYLDGEKGSQDSSLKGHTHT